MHRHSGRATNSLLSAQLPLHLLVTPPSHSLHRTFSSASFPRLSDIDSSAHPIASAPKQSTPAPPLQLPHLTPHSTAHIISITSKPPTHRTATATGTIAFSNPQTHAALISATLKKGDALSVARIAGIMAAKKTADLIPLCHSGLGLTGVEVDVNVIRPEEEREGNQGEGYRHGGVRISAKVECFGSTGVEMEALTAVSVAGLAVVDMCKSVDRGMVMGAVRVLEKMGGRSGDWVADGRGIRELDVKSTEGSNKGKWEGGVKVEGLGEMGRGWRRERDEAGRLGVDGKGKAKEGHAGEYDWDWD